MNPSESVYGTPPPVTLLSVSRVDYEPDGLPAMWAVMERKFLIMLESRRVGRSHVPVPKQLLRMEKKRRRTQERKRSGVSWHEALGRYQAWDRLPSGRRVYLGYHPTRAEAERAVARYRNARPERKAS